MENLLQSIACVFERVDLVTGKGNSDHLQNFETVFRKLVTAELKLRKESWKFMQSEVVHCCYVASEYQIGFVSLPLNSGERKYISLEIETLSVIFGAKKFHQYLYELPIYDIKALDGLFGDKRSSNKAASCPLR